MAANVDESYQIQELIVGISLRSFGGGASTTFLIYQNFVEKQNWLLPEEYTLYWNLSVMSPGTSIVGMTILIGRKLGSVGGVIVGHRTDQPWS